MQAVSRRNIQAGHTLPTIDASFYAIKFFHKSLLNVEPCSHFFLLPTCLKLQNESQLIKLIRPVWLNGWVFVYELSCCGFKSRCMQSLKKALSLDDLNKTFVKLNQSKSNLADHRLLTTILVAFCGFMRFSKQSRLSCSDFIFNSTYVKVFIEKSKTDIYRERMWIYISAFIKLFH